MSETNAYYMRVTPSIRINTCEGRNEGFPVLANIMGVCKLPSIELYWSLEHEDLALPLVRRVMPRNHFRQLLWCFRY